MTCTRWRRSGSCPSATRSPRHCGPRASVTRQPASPCCDGRRRRRGSSTSWFAAIPERWLSCSTPATRSVRPSATRSRVTATGRRCAPRGERERAAVAVLVGAAGNGLELTAAVIERVADTLHAAALDDRARAMVREGRLERELRHVGLGVDAGGAVAAAPGGQEVAPAKVAPRGEREREGEPGREGEHEGEGERERRNEPVAAARQLARDRAEYQGGPGRRGRGAPSCGAFRAGGGGRAGASRPSGTGAQRRRTIAGAGARGRRSRGGRA